MALKTPYATVEQANAYLIANDDWSFLTTSEKTSHLTNGRYFIDAKYICDEVDMTAIPEEYVYANSLLAEISLSTGLFNVDETGGNAVIKKRVVAGDVESEKIYAGQFTQRLGLGSIDPYPQITSLLDAYCTLDKVGDIKSVSLLRN